MKIAILNAGTVWGGAEVHTAGLARALVERGHDAFVVCLDEDAHSMYRSVLNGSVKLVALRSAKPVSKRSLMDWLAAFRGCPADACVYEKGTLHAGNLSLDMAARMHFRRYITIEQLEPPRLPSKTSRAYFGGAIRGLGLWWYRWLLRGYVRSLAPHNIIGVSDAVRQQLTRDYRFPRRKVITIHNGTDPARFCADRGFRMEMRRQWGLSDEAVVFGSVRRLAAEKGLDLAIEAFAKLVRKFPGRDMALVLVGEGPERLALEKLARECGVARQVIFTGLIVQAWKAYAAFDIFLMPSRIESFGIALLEAMASGCCAIASDAGGLPEILSDPSLGWLVPAGDEQALAQAMEAVLCATSDEKTRMVQRAREHVVKHFSAKAQFAKIAQIIENAAPSPVYEQDSLIPHRSFQWLGDASLCSRRL